MKWQTVGSSCGEVLEFNHLNPVQLKENFYKLIQKYEDYVRGTFATEAQQSTSRIIYSQLNYNLLNNKLCTFKTH